MKLLIAKEYKLQTKLNLKLCNLIELSKAQQNQSQFKTGLAAYKLIYEV